MKYCIVVMLLLLSNNAEVNYEPVFIVISPTREKSCSHHQHIVGPYYLHQYGPSPQLNLII
jgi:hypothetical protein